LISKPHPPQDKPGKGIQIIGAVMLAVTAVTAAIVTALWIELAFASQTHYFPAGLSDFLVRVLACFSGSTVGCFVWWHNRYLVVLSTAVFYSIKDYLRIREFFVIDWHPFQSISFFRNRNTTWLVSLLIVTLIGAVGGQFLGRKAARFVNKIARQGNI
jgi:hypothetical protein